VLLLLVVVLVLFLGPLGPDAHALANATVSTWSAPRPG
jgi:hypothetical protein